MRFYLFFSVIFVSSLHGYCVEESFQLDDYTPVKILGTGSFGVVFDVKKKDGSRYAVKRMEYSDHQDYKNEVKYLKMLGDHELIVTYIHSGSIKPFHYIVLEKVDTDLQKIIL